MHPHRRRKKRPNYGIRTVEVERGPNGFGFTISGQQPCILSCIVANSPADQAGLRAGDFLISVNGLSVSKITHDAVVKLIGNSVGPIKMSIAEYYYSDSSDEELDNRFVSSRKPKYIHKPRGSRHHKSELVNNSPEKKDSPKKTSNASTSNSVPIPDQDPNPIEYKALVGYLGTIEMPKQLLPNSRLQTVSSCIRKLRQEKRAPSAVLMTVLPSCLSLKNSSNQIIAIFPASRVVFISSTSEKESRYFGLVTSTVCENRKSTDDISNSCHVFVTDAKLVDHKNHFKRAETFKIACTPDIITGNCLEFPKNAMYVVSLVQNMYQKNQLRLDENNLGPLVANSPQPSASSNSDSGIGFRDDCGNISDRILVVEFPAQRSFPVLAPSNHRPCAIDGSNLPLDSLNNSYSINNVRAKSNPPRKSRDKSDDVFVKPKDPEIERKKSPNNWNNRLTVRAMPDPIGISLSSDELYRNADIDSGQIFSERPVDVPELNSDKSYFEHSEEIASLKGSIDNISVHSAKSFDLNTSKTFFKTPKYISDTKKSKKKLMNYDDSLLSYKLSPKVYGVSKPNYSCEELSNLDSSDKCNYGSLQDLSSWTSQDGNRRTIAASEPDVRIRKDSQSALEAMMCEDTKPQQSTISGGAAIWSGGFEKLLEDALGVQIFAEFLKKEFSAENIYFWTACERFRRLNGATERANEAQRIYRRHLCVGAPEPVNVDSQGRQYTQQALQDAQPKLFEQAQKQIFNLMKFDSYPRFLKSDLYKQCLAGTYEYPQLEVGLLLHPATSTPSKLKKSLSNAEDRRRKSLLPWHRKNRSKSKDRGESEYNLRKDGPDVPKNKNANNQSNVHSSQSSLTSLDLAMSCSMQDCSSSKGSHDELAPCHVGGKGALCRVILNDGATTVVQIRPTETVRQLANRLLDKRGLNYSAYEVRVANHLKAIDLNEMSSTLVGCEVIIEQRVVFKLDLPNRKVISVKSKTTKILLDVLRPILHKYGYGLDGVQVSINGCNEQVDVSLPVTSVDGQRLNIQLCNDSKNSVFAPNCQKPKSNASLDEITNKVFEQLLQEKSEISCGQTNYEKGSVKSEDWGSEHSSGIFGRFLRRDSAVHERKKKMNVLRTKGNSTHSSVEDITGEQVTKKPLIAKWKSGVKLQVACSESDELYEGLKRAQRCRLEDQRGTEINFELPDFLKDKENAQTNKFRKIQQNGSGSTTETARFYDNEMAVVPKQSPEKHTAPIAMTRNLKTEMSSHEDMNKSINSKLIPDDLKSNSCPTTPHKTFGSLENSFVGSNLPLRHSENFNISLKAGDPPPLPPKPKILPIKPSNWGQNNFFKASKDTTPKVTDRKQTLFLEHSTSSFV